MTASDGTPDHLKEGGRDADIGRCGAAAAAKVSAREGRVDFERSVAASVGVAMF